MTYAKASLASGSTTTSEPPQPPQKKVRGLGPIRNSVELRPKRMGISGFRIGMARLLTSRLDADDRHAP